MCVLFCKFKLYKKGFQFQHYKEEFKCIALATTRDTIMLSSNTKCK